MDTEGFRFVITEGTDVYGSDGDKVGSVVAVRPSYLVVEKGFFFPTDYYIPVSAVSGAEEGRVYLNVTKDAALNQGWDAVPADDETDLARTDAAIDRGDTIAGPVHEEERTLDVPVTEERVRVERSAEASGGATASLDVPGASGMDFHQPPSASGPDIPPRPRPKPRGESV